MQTWLCILLAGAVLLGSGGCTGSDSGRPAADLATPKADSLEACLAALRRDAADLTARLAYAEMLASLGQLDSALAQCEILLNSSTTHARALSLRGAILLANGAYDAALADLSGALAADSTLAAAWSNRGQARYFRGEYTAALADYDRALQYDPARTPVYFNRALALDRLGRVEAAAATFRMFLMRAQPLGLLDSRRYARQRLQQLSQAAPAPASAEGSER